MFNDEERALLEAMLIREKATALYELRFAQRLFGAYGDKRPQLTDRINVEQARFSMAERLLAVLRSSDVR